MAHAIQLKWTFVAITWAVFCLKIVSNFSKKATPANGKQNLYNLEKTNRNELERGKEKVCERERERERKTTAPGNYENMKKSE